jgi:hypothetical protein
MKSRNHRGKRKGSANEAVHNVQGRRTAEVIVEVPTNPGGGSVLTEMTNTQ